MGAKARAMTTESRWRRRPILLPSLGLILLIAGATGWDILAGYRAHRVGAERQLTVLANAAAGQVEARLRAVDLLMADAARSIDLARWPDEDAVAALTARLADFPEVHSLVVVNAAGRMLDSPIRGRGGQADGLDLADREYFIYQRDHWRNGNLYIGAPLISRLDNQLTLPMSRPIVGAGGRFHGVVVAAIAPAYFERVLQPMAGEHGGAALLLSTGIFMARSPDGAGFVGHSIADSSLFRVLLPGAAAGVARVPGLSNVGGAIIEWGFKDDHLLAYRQLASYPLVVTVSVPLPAALQEWRLRAWQGAAEVLVLSAVVVVLAYLLERHLTERTELLRQLAVEATLAEERERQAIATDLHDGLGQLLYVARIRLGTLAKALPNVSVGAFSLADLDGILDEAIRQVRSLGSQLSPPVLKDLGLVPALEWLAEEIRRSYGLTVAVEDDGAPKPLTPVQSAILFRAVRELLINVAKHADSDFAMVRIGASDGWLRGSVEDRGIGMVDWQAKIAAGKGFGLASLRERLRFLKGTMRINTLPGIGTTVTLEMPFDPPSAATQEAST